MLTVPVGVALRSFSERFVSDEPAVACLAEFAGVHQKTAMRWLCTAQNPVGEADLRVRVFLDAIGYHLIEVERLAQPAQTVLRLIGYGHYEPVQVQEMLGYANLQSLYRVLLRGDMPNKSAAYRLEMITRDSADDLAQAVEPWRERLEILRQRVYVLDPTEVDEAELPASPISPPNEQGTPVQVVTHRRRERSPGEHSVADVPANIRALSHTLFALENLISGLENRRTAAQRVNERVSPKRLQAIRSFVDQALKE